MNRITQSLSCVPYRESSISGVKTFTYYYTRQFCPALMYGTPILFSRTHLCRFPQDFYKKIYRCPLQDRATATPVQYSHLINISLPLYAGPNSLPIQVHPGVAQYMPNRCNAQPISWKWVIINGLGCTAQPGIWERTGLLHQYLYRSRSSYGKSYLIFFAKFTQLYSTYNSSSLIYILDHPVESSTTELNTRA